MMRLTPDMWREVISRDEIEAEEEEILDAVIRYSQDQSYERFRTCEWITTCGISPLLVLALVLPQGPTKFWNACSLLSVSHFLKLVSCWKGSRTNPFLKSCLLLTSFCIKPFDSSYALSLLPWMLVASPEKVTGPTTATRRSTLMCSWVRSDKMV